MAAKLNGQKLRQVFQGRPDILEGIKGAADTPDRVALFNEIASFVQERLSALSVDDGSSEQPASKRRRVDVAPTNGHAAANGAGAQVENEQVLLEVKDISLVVPQRKKYDLCFTQNFLYARAPGTSGPVQGIVYAWRDIEHAFYLPVPDKSQVQHNYVLFPRNSYLPTKPGDATAGPEPLVFTVPATAPKPGTIAGPSAATAEAVSDSYSSLLHWALTSLRTAGNTGCSIVASDPKIFASAARQAYRPGEKAVHVKAFRGSKDGYLFFLPTGILWGFKKPLLFLPRDRIVAVSYTSVLQRTFNMVIEYESGSDDATQEIEFAMLDQEDYQGIDETYVRRHGLADRSMAEQRKARRQLAENAKKEGGENGVEEGGANGMSELEKANLEAEQQLQDEEDEEEEDYDPGSDGESEGEGETSDEDEDGEGDGEGEEEEYDEEEEGEE